MSVDEIERAVEKLSRQELAAFREWFAEYDSNRWDEEIAEDAATGKLDKLAEGTLQNYRVGRARKI